MAYLDGIDVEVNRERALGMITQAAEADTPEAMQKLVSMYQDGVGTERSYHEALKWSKIYADYCRRNYDELDQRVVSAEREVARIYTMLGDRKTALEIQEELYEKQCKVLGENHPDTMNTLNSLVFSYSERREFDRALELFEKAYRQRLAALGSEHSETMRSLNNLSAVSINAGRREQAVKWADILCESSDAAIHEFIDNICII